MTLLWSTTFGLFIVGWFVLVLYAIVDVAEWLAARQRVEVDQADGWCGCGECVDARSQTRGSC